MMINWSDDLRRDPPIWVQIPVLPLPFNSRRGKKNMIKINIRNANIYTVLSLLLLIAGVGFYIYWGMRYGIWADIGVYALTILLVLAGLFGLILSLLDKNDESHD